MCEICGAYAFEKHLGTGKILDGGFTRNEKFEASGFGCLVVVFHDFEDLKNSRIEIRLCPNCARQFDLAISNKIAELKKKYESEVESDG